MHIEIIIRNLTEKYDNQIYYFKKFFSLKENRSRFSTSVVHTFDGTQDELKQFLDHVLYMHKWIFSQNIHRKT